MKVYLNREEEESEQENVESVVVDEIQADWKTMYYELVKRNNEVELELRETRLKMWDAESEARLYKASLEHMLNFLINFQR